MQTRVSYTFKCKIKEKYDIIREVFEALEEPDDLGYECDFDDELYEIDINDDPGTIDSAIRDAKSVIKGLEKREKTDVDFSIEGLEDNLNCGEFNAFIIDYENGNATVKQYSFSENDVHDDDNDDDEEDFDDDDYFFTDDLVDAVDAFGNAKKAPAESIDKWSHVEILEEEE